MEFLMAPIIIGVALLCVVVFAVYKASKFFYRCTKCGTNFTVNPVSAAFAPHSGGKKYLICPNCRKKQLCHLILKG